MIICVVVSIFVVRPGIDVLRVDMNVAFFSSLLRVVLAFERNLLSRHGLCDHSWRIVLIVQ